MYYLLESKRVTGPYAEETIRDRIYAGQLRVDTLACREGDPQEKWLPLEQALLGINSASRTSRTQDWNPPALNRSSHRRVNTQNAPDPNTAVLLEILPGMFCQVFGIGNIYAGNLGGGLTLMFGYWLIQFINIFLVFVFFLGIPLMILTFIGFLVIGSTTAANHARMQQFRAFREQNPPARRSRRV